MANVVPQSDAVCIIGAGPAGLSMARALKNLGIPYRQFERHSDVGGVWDITNPGTPMYHSAHFISSRDSSGFFDFPMPSSFPDYPSHHEILRYTREFARHFELYGAIDFSTAVKQLDHVDGGWRVQLDSGQLLQFAAVVCATGVTWAPNLPRHPGVFNGEIRHSVTFKHPDELRGKRVVIIGLGNSGADIACDAAKSASAAFISVRRGYHFIPKHVFGIPVDELAARGAHTPLWLKRAGFALLLRLLVGNVERLGLPKVDHKLFESHPLLNTQLLHYLQHGDIHARPDVERFDGDYVVFSDGARERADLVLYATGYEMTIPYAPRDYFEWQGGRPQLYLGAFNRRHTNLFGLGYFETNSSTYSLFDRISHLIAHHLIDQRERPERAHAFCELIRNDQPDLSGGIRFVDSDRHRAYIEIGAYLKYIEAIRRRMQWPELVSARQK